MESARTINYTKKGARSDPAKKKSGFDQDQLLPSKCGMKRTKQWIATNI